MVCSSLFWLNTKNYYCRYLMHRSIYWSLLFKIRYLRKATKNYAYLYEKDTNDESVTFAHCSTNWILQKTNARPRISVSWSNCRVSNISHEYIIFNMNIISLMLLMHFLQFNMSIYRIQPSHFVFFLFHSYHWRYSSIVYMAEIGNNKNSYNCVV